MPRRFDKYGNNRQFKWKPLRVDRWDPWPKDHLPWIENQAANVGLYKVTSVLGKRPFPGDDTARKKPRTRDEVDADHAQRRHHMMQLQDNLADPFGTPKKGPRMTTSTKAVIGLAAVGIAAPIAAEVETAEAIRKAGLIAGRLVRTARARSIVRRAGRVQRKPKIDGKLPRFLRKQARRIKKGYRLQRDLRKNPDWRWAAARRGIKYAWNKYA